jgi:hypothetical protein
VTSGPDLALVLTRQAIGIGFDKLTYAELGMVVRRQKDECARWAEVDSAEGLFRRRLHANLGAIATTTAARKADRGGA